jgi:septum formation protein
VILLASGSPRRHALLREYDIPFKVIPNRLKDEPVLNSGPNLKQELIDCAVLKAKASSEAIDNWILTADTIVVFNQHVLGKPSTKDEAKSMLEMLSGTSHSVYTGFCLFHPTQGHCISHVDEAVVTFNTLSSTDIASYIASKQPFDKAGSYGIQEVPDHFISSFSGDIETVIGLRVKSVLKLLRDYDIV